MEHRVNPSSCFESTVSHGKSIIAAGNEAAAHLTSSQGTERWMLTFNPGLHPWDGATHIQGGSTLLSRNFLTDEPHPQACLLDHSRPRYVDDQY